MITSQPKNTEWRSCRSGSWGGKSSRKCFTAYI